MSQGCSFSGIVLETALRKDKPVIFNPDQSRQYKSNEFTDILKDSEDMVDSHVCQSKIF